jgi:uncharacterized protein YbjQ (UPF0145 family)
MLVVTSNDIPGYRVTAVIGEVMGVTVRSRNMFSQMGAGFKAMAGGELKGMTKQLTDSRLEVMGRLMNEAAMRGANAVVAFRFDASDIGGTWTEICAYGTAVVIVPVPGGVPGATEQSAADAAQQGIRPPVA